MHVRPATLGDLDGLVASTAALFAEDGAARDALRNANWPAIHAVRMHFTAYATNEGALRLYASRGFAAKSITLAAEL